MTFSVTILGSSSALPTSKRYTSACAVNLHERFFLIDCGEGIQIQLRKFKIKFGKINHIFLSHLHGDHFFGLYGLISSFNLIGRKNDLHIYAHKDIRKILNNHFKYFDKNKEFKIILHYLDEDMEQLIYEDKNIIIKSFPLNHRIPACGYLFQEKKRQNHIYKEKIEEYDIPLKNIIDIKNGADFITKNGEIIENTELTYPSYEPRSFAYCSDTIYHEPIAEKIKNCNLLWHESTFLEDNKVRAKETFHSTAQDAAKIAKRANVKNLILSHFSSRYKELSGFSDEAKKIFEHVFIANEGDEYTINTNGELILKKYNSN